MSDLNTKGPNRIYNGIGDIPPPKYRYKTKKKGDGTIKVKETLHIYSTKNNTILSLTNQEGKIISSLSCGMLSTSRQSANYTAQQLGEMIAKKAISLKITKINVKTRGFGHGKTPAIRGLKIGKLRVNKIMECTNIPHNGCRSPKKRRL